MTMKIATTKKLALFAAALALPVLAVAGFFPQPAGSQFSDAVPATSPDIVGWANGYQSYQPGLELDAVFQTPQKALGIAGNSNGNNEGFSFDIVSLGRGGSIVMTFNPPIFDGDGDDFAVFENSFSDTFLELATVSVSSDGVNFVKFPALSTVPAPVGGFGSVDASDLEQVAGKYRGGFGTPFDLSQLAGNPMIDVDNIGYVRIDDIVGDGSAPNDISLQAVADWANFLVSELPAFVVDITNAAPPVIYDPFPTVGSAGFDLDAVAVMNQRLVAVMDILPADPQNTIDPDSTAVIPVAVLTEGGFDATQVDPASLRFAFSEAPNVVIPTISDVDGDGDSDMSFGFNTQQTGILCEDTEAELLGETLSGEAFSATDFIATGECDDGGCHP